MRTSVFGTGSVGRVLAARLAELGHDVVMGTRVPEVTRARVDADEATGGEPFSTWLEGHPGIELVDFAAAGSHGDLLVNATAGTVSEAALQAAGNLDGKVLLDVANALDFSQGFPPSLAYSAQGSLAEHLQQLFPRTRVVKSLNTVNHLVMVEPGKVPGEHTMFVAGNDADAKSLVTGLLREFGWPADNILDLGGIEAARSMELYLPLWLSIMQATGTMDFNIHVARQLS